MTWPFGTSGNAMVTLNFAESLQRGGNWSLTSASGSYTEPAQPDNHYPGCNATLTRNASAAAMLGSYGPNVITRRSGYWTAELFPPTYWGVQGDPVNSSQTTGDCATSARVDYAGLSHSLGGAQCHFDPNAGNTEAIDFPVSSSYTVPDNCTGTITSNAVNYNVTLQSSATFTSPGVVPPGSTPTNTPQQVRDYAQGYWQHLVPIYLDWIAVQNIILKHLDIDLVFVPFSGLQPTITRYVRSSDFNEQLMLKAMIKAYEELTKLLVLLDEVYHDPALPGYSQVAPIPKVTPFRFEPSSCTRIPSRARRFCTHLERDAARWLDAGASYDALAQALATDTGRETAAAQAKDQAALARLRRAELSLLPRLRAAQTSQQRTGARFGADLRAIGVDIRLTPQEAASANAQLFKRLAAKHVSPDEVRAILAGTPLQPRSLSLVALLGG